VEPFVSDGNEVGSAMYGVAVASRGAWKGVSDQQSRGPHQGETLPRDRGGASRMHSDCTRRHCICDLMSGTPAGSAGIFFWFISNVRESFVFVKIHHRGEGMSGALHLVSRSSCPFHSETLYLKYKLNQNRTQLSRCPGAGPRDRRRG